MDLEIICNDGICFMALCNNNNNIMLCCSIVNSLYTEMPNNYILLDKNNYNNNIIILDNVLFEQCEFIIDIVSNNSICLRAFIINNQYNTVKFKINQGGMFKISKKFLNNHNKLKN